MKNLKLMIKYLGGEKASKITKNIEKKKITKTTDLVKIIEKQRLNFSKNKSSIKLFKL